MNEANEMRQEENIRTAAKWIMVLFWLSIASIVAGAFSGDAIADLVPLLTIFGNIAGLAVSAAYAVVLIKMDSVDRDYRRAAVYVIAGVLLSAIAMFLPDANGRLESAIWTLVPGILGLVLDLVSKYYEYGAHAGVLKGIDPVMSEKWRRLWRWTLEMTIGLIIGAVASVLAPILGLLILIVVVIGLLVVGVLRLVYLYQTARRLAG